MTDLTRSLLNCQQRLTSKVLNLLLPNGECHSHVFFKILPSTGRFLLAAKYDKSVNKCKHA